MSERIGSIEAAERRRDMRPVRIGRAPAWLAVLLFLATVVAVPVAQHIDVARRYRAGLAEHWLPECYRLADDWPAAWAALSAPGALLDRTFAANRILLAGMRRYERDVEDGSWLTRLCLPKVGRMLAVGLRGGTEQVVVGRSGWLYYRPDLEYVTGPGFLDPRALERRRRGGAEWDAPVAPDPRPAILAFDRALRARGIRLLLMPVPVKPVVCPHGLAPSAAGVMSQNASHAAFVHELRRSGVAVFDCAGLLRERRGATGSPAYLARDTHWRPEAVDWAAERLAGSIRSMGALPPRPAAGYRRTPSRVEGEGDTAAMLRPPGGAPTEVDLESVEIRRVVRPDDRLWAPDPESDVLVLGDSFVNIYSLSSLGWGSGAGLAEQLSYHLQRPVDRIARNDRGADATRRELAARLESGDNPLRGKRVVVWAFSTRELSAGNWDLTPLSAPDRSRPPGEAVDVTVEASASPGR